MEGKILNATCGPQTGTLALNQYLASARDYDPDLEKGSLGSVADIWLNESMASLGSSLNSIHQSSIDTIGNMQMDEGKIDSLKSDILDSLVTKADLDAYFSVNKLLGELKKSLAKTYEIDGRLSHAEVRTYPNPGHRVSWNMTFKDKKQVKNLVDLEIYICAGPASVKAALARTLWMKNDPTRGELMWANTKKNHIRYLLDTDLGNHTSHAHWVYKSVSVNLYLHDNLGEGVVEGSDIHGGCAKS